MKPQVEKPPRQEKIKTHPLKLTTINGDVPKEPKEKKKKQKKIAEIATISEAPKAPKQVTKVKPQFEILRGQYTLSFE